VADLFRYLLIYLFFNTISFFAYSQGIGTHADSLQGYLRAERLNYNVHHYDLRVEIDPASGSISGACKISFHWTGATSSELQIDLFSQFIIDSIVSSGQLLAYRRDGNAFFIERPDSNDLEVFYHGKPQVAIQPPWQGGFVWSKDGNGNSWGGVACEGIGASSWWPLKDHPSDEPDSMDIRFIVPRPFTIASNGILLETSELTDERRLFYFKVNCPINAYNVTFYLGDYTYVSDSYMGLSGKLNLKYYFLKEDLDGKVKYFKHQTARMLRAFEYYFGPYPCYTDGYGLAEAPYWGMEHQGMIAYGNNLQLLPDYGFDFILVHESGHEWFGNSISCDDHAEMWIHEGFTTYSEALYVEYYQGNRKSLQYLLSQKEKISGNYPLIGSRDIHHQHKDADIYYKGTWFLHTLRNVFHDDKAWFRALREFSASHTFQVIDTQDVLRHFQKYTKVPLASIFAVYLYQLELPKLRLYMDIEGEWKSEWLQVGNSGFGMPVYGRDGKRIDPDGILDKAPTLRQKDIEYVKHRYLIDIQQVKIELIESK
jgi:aminopeptidase N